MSLILLMTLTACQGGPPAESPTGGSQAAAETGSAGEDSGEPEPAAEEEAGTADPDADQEPDPLPGLVGDTAALQEALAAAPVRFDIRTIQEADVPDRTAYLDQVLEREGMPPEGTLLILVFSEHNHEMRFAMGAGLSEQGLTVERMLDLVRNVYQPTKQEQDPATALAALVQAVSREIEDGAD